MTARSSRTEKPVTADDYQSLADFRYALRNFLQFSADAAKTEGLSPQQHQALLAVKGHAGEESPSIGELAVRLHLKHHSTVGLIDRLGRKKLLRRVPSQHDKRKVLIALTPQGEAMINRLSSTHREELRQIAPSLQRSLAQLTES